MLTVTLEIGNDDLYLDNKERVLKDKQLVRIAAVISFIAIQVKTMTSMKARQERTAARSDITKPRADATYHLGNRCEDVLYGVEDFERWQ